MRRTKRILFGSIFFLSGAVYALPEYMEASETGVWSVLKDTAWVKANGDNPAAMTFRCFVAPGFGARVAMILVQFDKEYTDEAKIIFPAKGLEQFSFKRSSTKGIYELKPLQLGINMLYGSPDNAVLPVLVLDGEAKDFYAFSMENSSGSAKQVLELCGALK